MPRGSSAPRYTVDAIIACVMEAIVGFSELAMFVIDKWAAVALIVRNLAAMPPTMRSLLHDQFVMLTRSMVRPVRANGRRSSHKMCPDVMSPFGPIAGCLSSLVPRSQPQVVHFVACAASTALSWHN